MDEHFPNFGFEIQDPFITAFAFATSNCLVCEDLCKFSKALILGPICPNLYFSYSILKYLSQIRYKHLQILTHEQNFK